MGSRGAGLKGPAPGGDRAEARALLLLGLLPGVGLKTQRALVDAFGSGVAALGAGRASFAAVAGARAAGARSDPELRAAAGEALERAARTGARVVVEGGPGYPTFPDTLHDPPPVLFLRGDPSLLDAPIAAVVGSRRATVYGRRTAGRLAAALARAGVVVASGLALGVDAAAHRGALDAGGRTLAVLGAGVDVPHPATNAALFDLIAREHLLVSEFLPGMTPAPHHFPRRNRILAALSRGVFVVEAARRSGALITARLALEMGLDVVGVPGPVDRATSRGVNRLIQDGAGCLTDPDRPGEVLAWIEEMGEEPGPAGPGGSPSNLGPDAVRVWGSLEDGPGTADELSRRLDRPVPVVLSVLSLLEIEGWVEPRPGMRFARCVRS